MQKRLSLARAAIWIAILAVVFYLRYMTPDGFPTFYLANVVVRASTEVIAAIPLEPTARVLEMNPTFLLPLCKRLTGIYTEIVELRFCSANGKLCLGKPAFGKFMGAIRHVLTTEDAQSKHLFGRQFGFELVIEVAADGRDEDVAVVLLHLVMNND